MARDIDASAAAASKSEVVRPVIAADLDFASGHIRVNSSPQAIVIDGNTYLGLGKMGAITGIEEGTELQSYGIAMKLSGVEAAHVAAALNEDYQGRKVAVWLVLLDENHAQIGSPTLLGRWRMDTMSIEMGAVAEITLTAHSLLADWERPRIARFNDADQRARFPGDLGFEYVAQMVDKQLVWGRS
jgi:hypothetical protein